MKHTLPIILLALVLVTACHSDQRQLARLHRAQTLIDTAPDTALALLDSIDSHSLMRADNALYALLMSQALDKNYIDITNDSLINIAVEHYTHSHNKYYKMLSYYYYGRVKYNAQEYAKSIVALLTAEKIAMELNDNYRLGLIYQYISDIYNAIYWGEGAVEYAQKSYDAYSKTDYHEHTNYSLLNLGIMYYNSYKYDECEQIMNKVLKQAIKQNDATMKVEALIMLASTHWVKEDFINAITLYNKAISINDTIINATHFSRLSNAYSKIGNNDEAYKYANIAYHRDSTQVHAYYVLYENSGNYKEALQALKQIMSQQNNVLDNITTQSILKSVEDYQSMEYDMKHKIKKQQLITLSCISILVIILIIATSYIQIRKKRLEIEHNILIAQNLQQSLYIKNAKIGSLQKEMSRLFEQQFSTLDKLCSIYYESNNINTYNKILNIINNVGKDPATRKAIEDNANKYCDNIIQDFRNSFPKLKEDDYLLFLYLVIGFSHRTIAILLQIKLDTLYSRKYKLKQKIESAKSDHEEAFLKYFS